MWLLLLACAAPDAPAPAASPAPAAPSGPPGPTPDAPGAPTPVDMPPAADTRPGGAEACLTPATGDFPVAPAEGDVLAGWLDVMGKRTERRPLLAERTVEWVDRPPLDAAALAALAPAADAAAYADGVARSQRPGSLTALGQRAVGWTVLPERDRVNLFSGPGWDAFPRQYPDAGGLLSVTRVGFDPGCSRMVFGYYLATGELKGSTWLVWGRRDGDGWRIEGEVAR